MHLPLMLRSGLVATSLFGLCCHECFSDRQDDVIIALNGPISVPLSHTRAYLDWVDLVPARVQGVIYPGAIHHVGTSTLSTQKQESLIEAVSTISLPKLVQIFFEIHRKITA